MAAGRFVSVDKGEAALVARLAEAAKGKTLTVGVHEEDGSAGTASGLSVAEVATINEFGLGVPARPSITAWADENGEKVKGDFRKLGEALVQGKIRSVDQGLDAIGLKSVGEIQAKISGGIEPANAPSTIAKKGSSTPLIDKGQFRSSIRHKVT